MGRPMIYDGKPLMRFGKPALGPGCCCRSTCPTGAACTGCDTRTLTLSGLTGEPCDEVNGDWGEAGADESIEGSPTVPDGACAYLWDVASGDGWVLAGEVWCENGLWFALVDGYKWHDFGSGPVFIQMGWRSSTGRSGTCAPTGAYNLDTDLNADYGGSDCEAPTFELS